MHILHHQSFLRGHCSCLVFFREKKKFKKIFHKTSYIPHIRLLEKTSIGSDFGNYLLPQPENALKWKSMQACVFWLRHFSRSKINSQGSFLIKSNIITNLKKFWRILVKKWFRQGNNIFWGDKYLECANVLWQYWWHLIASRPYYHPPLPLEKTVHLQFPTFLNIHKEI